MKKYQIVAPLLAAVLTVGGTSLLLNKNSVRKVSAVNLPTTINLNDCSENEIKDYYSSLSSKSESELTGTNLLKNLKSVISNNVTYFSYGQAEHAYPITDRDWANSPASEIDGYNSSTNTISGYSYKNDEDRKYKESDDKKGPYIHMLYHDYSTGDKTRYSGDGDVSSSTKSFDNEHAWSQSHGFATTSDNNNTGAGSDLHHLIAGTQYGNRTLHNNYSYGFVDQNDGSWTDKPNEKYNKRGNPKFPHSQDQQNRVFEPQDSDKGDIARALLYMVACYNNLDGSTPTKASPALELKNYVISENSTGFSFDNIANGYYGCLSDILAWHELDPVDEYEIHRNDLIFNNYQHNRNPFIDYPQWVGYIWGTANYDGSSLTYDSTPTGHVDLTTDVVYGEKVKSLEIQSLPTKTEYRVGDTFDKTGLVAIATLEDDTTKDVTDVCKVNVDLSKEGEQTVTFSYRGKTAPQTLTITVKAGEEKKEFPMKTVIIIGAAVVGVIVIILIFAGILKVNKKGKVSVNKSKVKKVVKGTIKKKK